MGKRIEVIFLKQAEEFTNSLEINPKRKLFQAMRKTKERLFGQWFTKLKSSDEYLNLELTIAVNIIDSLHFGTQKKMK